MNLILNANVTNVAKCHTGNLTCKKHLSTKPLTKFSGCLVHMTDACFNKLILQTSASFITFFAT